MAAPRANKIGEHRTAYDKNKKRIFATQTICGICGKPVDFSLKYPDPLSATIDHIIPIAKGGHPSDIGNLQLAHRWCNRQKSDKYFDIKSRFREAQETISNDDLPLHCDWRRFKAGGG